MNTCSISATVLVAWGKLVSETIEPLSSKEKSTKYWRRQKYSIKDRDYSFVAQYLAYRKLWLHYPAATPKSSFCNCYKEKKKTFEARVMKADVLSKVVQEAFFEERTFL